MIRPSWDEVRMKMAHSIAQRSLCARAKVGAIVVGPSGDFVGEGYNGPPSGYVHGNQPCNIWCKRANGPTPAPDYSDCYTIHAEANALLKSDYTARKGGAIYVTSHVCWGCAKLIANSGVSLVVVDATRPDQHRDPLASYAFMLECGLDVQLSDEVMQYRLYGDYNRQKLIAGGWVAGESTFSTYKCQKCGQATAITHQSEFCKRTGQTFEDKHWCCPQACELDMKIAYPERLVD